MSSEEMKRETKSKKVWADVVTAKVEDYCSHYPEVFFCCPLRTGNRAVGPGRWGTGNKAST